jgi:hypothetical protein
VLTPAVGLAVLVLGGCGEDETQVRAYSVPKEAAMPRMASVETPAEPQAAPAVMEWKLPAGWQQIPNPNNMRFATFAAGGGDSRIEVAVSSLSGGAGGITANIERWRGQLGLGPSSGDDENSELLEIQARGTRGLMVDLIAPAAEESQSEPLRMLATIYPAGGQTWFVKATAPRSVVEQHRDAFVAFCESVRFPSAMPQPPPTARAPRTGGMPGRPSWGGLPEGWTQDAQPRAMSVASFSVSDGNQEAALTITPLPGPPNLLGNINRWRGQVGLEPMANLEQEPPTEIEVAGQAGHLVDLGGADLHMLGVIAQRGRMVWFYKLTGPDPLVGNQRAAFEDFVRSISFDGESGG